MYMHDEYFNVISIQLCLHLTSENNHDNASACFVESSNYIESSNYDVGIGSVFVFEREYSH